MTENTFDAFSWQVLENKQKFISQIMTSKSPVRSCEDVDDAALSYAEIKALATGNIHIKEKMDLDIQVSRLKLLKANHTSQRYRLETDIARKYPVEIQAVKRRLGALKSDWKAAERILAKKEKDEFAMTVEGIVYTERKEAGMALLAACAGARGMESVPVGKFQGFRLSVGFDGFNHRYLMTVSREGNYRIEMGKDSLGNLKRLQNLLAALEGEIPKAEQKLENLNRQLAAAKEEAARPFPKEQELAEKLERLAELNALLNMDGKDEIEAIEAEEEETDQAEENVEEEAENLESQELSEEDFEELDGKEEEKRKETSEAEGRNTDENCGETAEITVQNQEPQSSDREEKPWTLQKLKEIKRVKEMQKQCLEGTKSIRPAGTSIAKNVTGRI